MANAIHTCQWENSPFEMTKSSVQPTSMPRRHNPKTRAITATGVKNAETASAASCEAIAVVSKADCNLFATLDVVHTTAEEVRAHAGWRIPPILMTVIPSSLLCRCTLNARSFESCWPTPWITSFHSFWIWFREKCSGALYNSEFRRVEECDSSESGSAVRALP